MKELLKRSILVSVLLLSNAYCSNINTNGNNDGIRISIMPQDSSIFTESQLQDIVINGNEVLFDNNRYEYDVLDLSNLRLVIFKPNKLSNTINDVLTSTYNEIKSTNNPGAKIKTADTFYRIIYNPTKLLFLECYSDLNLLETINDIVNELKPFCKEYAIANPGGKQVLYGIEKLEASLPTINNQFINGLNFQMDFTRTQLYNEKKFKECYEKIFTNIPAISGCVKLGRLKGMIQTSVYYREMGDNLSYLIKYYSKSESKLTNNIDRYVTILSNLESFLRDK